MKNEKDSDALFSKQRWMSMKSRGLVQLSLLSAALLVLAVIVYYLVVPIASTYVITKLKELRNDTHILRMWQNPPVPMMTSVYIWNLTNAEDVSAGRSAPIFKQAGPYVYEQRLEKLPKTYKENSIVYMSRAVYKYRADLTQPASEDDIVVTLNAGLYGAALLVNSLSPSMMSMVNQALPYLFPGVDSLFVPARVGSFLFDGVLLNCSNNNGTLAEMVCKMIPSYAPPMIRRKENSSDFLYSFFSHMNNSLQGPFEEDRGLRDIHRVGQLVSLRNTSRLRVWQPDSRCDILHGHDVYTFPPFIRDTDLLHIFIPEICQQATVQYQSTDILHGLPAYKYVLSAGWLASSETNPDNGCFCLKNKEQFCSQNGVRDVSPCMKGPIVISLPHFYLADNSFREYAQGMSPDSERHTSFVYVEPQTGTQLVAAKRVQFNVYLKRLKGLPMAENLSEGLFPMLWVEELGEVTEDLLGPVLLPLTIQKVARVTSVVAMILAVAVATGAMVTFCFINRLWCCGRVPHNQVTALFYRHSRTQDDGRSEENNGPGPATHTFNGQLYPHATEH